MPESQRLASVQSPIIPVVAELIRAHPGTISLGQGVVFYGPPPSCFEALADFKKNPENHKYQPVHGIAPLRDALQKKLRIENGIELSRESFLAVTAGGNMAFMNAILAILDPGDEVLLPSPYYFNHEMALVMIGAKPVCVPTNAHYEIDVAQMELAITPRTRAIVTVSPNNPTGAVYPESSLRAVNALCRARGLYHISDEAYEYFTYEDAAHFSCASLPDSAGHTLSLFSLSKAYGFASWRIGYMIVPAHLASAVKKIQDTILICPPVISQYAATAALQAGKAYCQEHLKSLAEVRQFVIDELSRLGDLCQFPRSRGAFYFLLKLATALPPLELVEKLVREHGVAAIPGTAFGLNDGCYLRISYGALGKSAAMEGIRRLTSGLRSLLG